MDKKTIRKMADECGLILIDKVGDPALVAVHIYTQPKEGVEWSPAAEKLSEKVYKEFKMQNKVYKGRKHPDLYNFSSIDD
jgi:hypothetical protein